MNPNFMAFLKQIQFCLVLAGGLLAEQGFDHTSAYKWVMFGSGSVIAIGSALWGLWSSYENWRKAAAVGVQAGINLTVAGKALAADGTSVVSANDGSTPPKPITVATGAEIVKDFGPTTPIAKV